MKRRELPMERNITDEEIAEANRAEVSYYEIIDGQLVILPNGSVPADPTKWCLQAE
jgi:hypothetical protein